MTHENENGLTHDERVSVNTALIAAYDALTLDDIDTALHRIMDVLDIVGIQTIERCAYCDQHATHTCDVCGASLCNDHGAMHGDGFVCRYIYA